MDIVTLTLNPCLDLTLWVGAFGGPVRREHWQTGGKGVNVARVLKALGVRSLAVCPLGGAQGDRFLSLARDEGIDVLPVPVKAETRAIDTWVRESDFRQRVDYRAGSELADAELDELENRLFSVLPGAKALVVAGSASCGRAAGRVSRILRRAREMGVKTVLDSNGPALTGGVKGLPDLLKPNEKELFSLVGSAEPDAAEALLHSGVGAVLLSMGARGCCLIREGVQKYCPAPRVEAVNPVGSGDSFLAGYLYAALRGYYDELSMMIACAAGAANARVFPAARIKREDIEMVLGQSI